MWTDIWDGLISRVMVGQVLLYICIRQQYDTNQGHCHSAGISDSGVLHTADDPEWTPQVSLWGPGSDADRVALRISCRVSGPRWLPTTAAGLASAEWYIPPAQVAVLYAVSEMIYCHLVRRVWVTSGSAVPAPRQWVGTYGSWEYNKIKNWYTHYSIINLLAHFCVNTFKTCL